jgi:histidine ammonia-lyase
LIWLVGLDINRLALRINVLAKGHSGIREETVRHMLAALRANCLPWVPAKGTVGASGDLAPLSHLALGLMGEGKMWDPTANDWRLATDVLKKHGLTPLELQAKEGLALINGTQLIASLGAEAIVRAKRIARQADIVAALYDYFPAFHIILSAYH